MLELNVLLICIEAYIFLYRYKSERNRKTFLVLTCIQAILLSGLRHIDVGPDTYNYVKKFEAVIDYSWEDLFKQLFDFKNYKEIVEPGYILSVKIFQIFSKNPRIYLIAFACFVNIPLFRMFYRRSSDVFLSVLVYQCLYFAFVSTTGLRQTMVFVLVNYIGVELIKKRKLMPFLITVAICYTIHRSALAVLPLYFIAYKKPTPAYFICCIGAIGALFVLKSQFTSILAFLGGYESYSEQYKGAGTWNFTIIMVALMAVSMIQYKLLVFQNKENVFYMNATIVAIMLLPLTFIDPTNLRVVFYYAMYVMLLVPEAVATFRGKDKRLVYLIVVVLLILLYMSNEHYYAFFWQSGRVHIGPSV